MTWSKDHRGRRLGRLGQGLFHPGAKRRCPGAPAPACPMLPLHPPQRRRHRLQTRHGEDHGKLPPRTARHSGRRGHPGRAGLRQRRRRAAAPGLACPPHLDLWRQGRVACLERMVQAGLGKQSTAMRTMRPWAARRGLSPSETAYLARTRDRRQLRFSVSGQPDIERAYHTHWVSPDLSARKAETAAQGGGPAAGPGRGGLVDRVDMRRLRHQRRGPAPHAGRPTALPALLPARPSNLPAGRRRARTDGRIAPAPGPRSWSTSAGPASATNDRVCWWNPMR